MHVLVNFQGIPLPQGFPTAPKGDVVKLLLNTRMAPTAEDTAFWGVNNMRRLPILS